MTLQEQLDEALTARHELLIGRRVTVRGHGDRNMTFAPADLAQLDRYISELRQRIAGNTPRRSSVRYVVPD